MTLAAAQLPDPLETSRRLDWRFLLPDPTLGHVGYFGPDGGTLVGALRRFAASVDDAAPTSETARAARPSHALHDLLVLVEPSRAVLEHALGGLRPGGALYVELTRSFHPLRAYRPGRGRGGAGRDAMPVSPGECTEALAARGWLDVRRYWCWPSFESCKEIVPLDDRAALRLFLSRRGGSGRKRLGTALGRVLVRTDRLGDLAPSVGIVAVSPHTER